MPSALTRFIGREREIAAVTDLLGATRLLTLTGSGGSGKTRLALAVAGTQIAAYPDGVWFVELAGLTDPALVPQAIATSLAAREEPRRSLHDTLTDVLRTQDTLLVLDNCEHVIAAVAALVDMLLRACPNLHILTTSREALRVPGEMTWRVPSLSLPEMTGAPSATRLATSEAVQLFVDRIRLHQPGFAVTDANAAAVAAICQRLDGMPLALELAAARASALTIAELGARLDDALRVLTAGERTAAPRQQTLRATLDWSFALLTDEEKIVLRRLAVFAGGCRLTAAEEVCAGDGIAREDVLALVTQLVEKSLVQMEEREDAARYRLLETVRQYATKRLEESGETERIQQRHADWLLALVREAGPALDGPEQGKWLHQLDPELDNVRVALRWLLQTGRIVQGLRICANLWRFWYAHDLFIEGSRWLTAFLARGQEADAHTNGPNAWMDGIFAAGRLAIFRGEYEEARVLLEEMLTTAKHYDSPHHIAFALMLLGHIALEQCDYAVARSLYAEGIPYARAANDLLWAAILSGSLGIVHVMQGNIVTAHGLFDECLSVLQTLGDTGQLSRLLRWQGVVAILERDTEAARMYLVEGIRLHQTLHSLLGIAESLEVFAALYVTAAQPTRALRLIGAAMHIRSPIAAPVPPYWQEWLTQWIEPARRTLGMAASAAASAAGEAMSLEEAIAEALATTPPRMGTATDRRTSKTRDGGLTKRERVVVAQIATGKSNRQIAASLFVTVKTVEWHVTNSLAKLGFRSRAELAVWAVAAQIAPSASPPRETDTTR